MEMNEYASRRKHPRLSLPSVVSVIDCTSGESVGTVANLSLEGLMLVNSKPLCADSIYQLRLSVTDDSALPVSIKNIEIGVDCLWTSPAQSDTASTYWSGCQIIDIAEPDFELVRKLIAALGQ